MKMLSSENVYVSKSSIPYAGRGVRAVSTINKGELIERCPFIEVPRHEASLLNQSFLVTYFFYFGKLKEQVAIVLGFGSLYNHSAKPNATYKIDAKRSIVDFIALENISKDTEITFDYYHDSTPENKKNPLWFEV
jgi:uncharacterized protein